MTKRRSLNIGQQRRVHANQQKKLTTTDDNARHSTEIEDNTLGASQAGLVISRYGQHADVETGDGIITRCDLRRNITSLVTGDKVIVRLSVEPQSGIGGVVEAAHPRTSSLTRPDLYDGVKIIAANIDQVFIVSSLIPSFSTQIIDRYIVAAEDTGIHPIIILNKIDLIDANTPEISEAIERYNAIGYPVYLVSSITGFGIDKVRELLKDKTSVFAGQSGVGKSSLINALLPDVELITGAVSENSGLGQHTTTVAKLLHFPSGGHLIDSPGVREFALWHLSPERVSWCFIEFRGYLGSCKFRDCKHDQDPGCSLQQALLDGKISADRFNNYHKIINSLDEQRHARRFQSKD